MEHAIDSFREGETVVLTLKDKGELSWLLCVGLDTVELGQVVTAGSALLSQGYCRRGRMYW